MNLRRVLKGEEAAARVDLEDLETMVSTRKYLPIARILLQEGGTRRALRSPNLKRQLPISCLRRPGSTVRGGQMSAGAMSRRRPGSELAGRLVPLT